ncbi:lipid II:glycine glycyltransferase FemX [Fodinibius saliphilus]|uniref:lipid II:glycine glycyltransferase FemX n=1 Tax=Fodinibius saliphilus TaxID=1920650 RepID=UPI0011094812|nr:GNAT family N-acetyltransferase [Fodinibius saliphilus]
MKIIKNADHSLWRKVAEACPYATFFHSPLWHTLIEKVYSDKVNRPIALITDRGTKAILPLVQTSQSTMGILRNYESSFAGCYGGIIADGELKDEEVTILYKTIQELRTGEVYLTDNPLRSHWNANTWINSFDRGEDDFTQIISLDQSFEKVLEGFSRGHRSSMNKGLDMGVSVRTSANKKDYKAYFEAYQASLERWGADASSSYSWDFFEECYRLNKQYPSNVKLWLAEVEGELASGAIVFYWNNHIDYWHGASYKKYFDYRANNVLHPEIMKDGIEKGFRFYDFNPSGGHEGVANFKSRFGSSKWPVKRGVISGKLLKAVKKVKSI